MYEHETVPLLQKTLFLCLWSQLLVTVNLYVTNCRFILSSNMTVQGLFRKFRCLAGGGSLILTMKVGVTNLEFV